MQYNKAKLFILSKLKQELHPDLAYHGVHHTLDVLEVTEELCRLENISERNTVLLKTAALFHDAGFTIFNKEHELLGCLIVKQHLPRFDYSKEDIQRICEMIMSTKIPQSPQNELEEILCDADLDYLGRDDFWKIGNSLFEELKKYNVLKDDESWNRLQVSFLNAHQFFTDTNKQRRSPQKVVHLKQLEKIVADYEK